MLLKVSPWKGLIHFGKNGKLSPRYIGPFEIMERIGPGAYKLNLPPELSAIHGTFQVSNLKKCLADESLVLPLEEVQVSEQLHVMEKLVEVLDREIKRLRRNRKISLGPGVLQAGLIMSLHGQTPVLPSVDVRQGHGAQDA